MCDALKWPNVFAGYNGQTYSGYMVKDAAQLGGGWPQNYSLSPQHQAAQAQLNALYSGMANAYKSPQQKAREYAEQVRAKNPRMQVRKIV